MNEGRDQGAEGTRPDRRASERTLDALSVAANVLLTIAIVMLFLWACVPGAEVVPLSIGLGGLAIALLAGAAGSWLKRDKG